MGTHRGRWKWWSGSNWRLYALGLLLEFGLLWGGFSVLTGLDHRENRLLGALALAAGLAGLVLLVAPLRRLVTRMISKDGAQ